MRFSGKMIDSLCMRRFSSTITTLSKLGKRCIIRLTPSNVFFIITDESVPARPLAWCVLEQAHFFNKYDVIGFSEQFNEIYMQFSPAMLAKALSSLKSPQTSKSIKIKLSKKKTPCLTCEIELATMLQHSRLCTHDIPVEIIPQREWSEFKEPKLPNFDVSIQMPNLKLFRNICERMKSLSQYVIVSANRLGVMSLKVETDLATVLTHFSDLIMDMDINEDQEKCFTTRVDCKKMINFLSIEQVNPSKVVCNIVEKKLIHMHVVHEDVILHYFIPAVSK